MIKQSLADLSTIPGVRVYPGLSGEATAYQSLGLVLPECHRQFLELCNGLEAYWGYFRIFGVGKAASVDSVLWNQHECWKFAWEARCVEYWCFAETAWGDQFAYRTDELRSSLETIYLLDCLSMTPVLTYPCFASFFDIAAFRWARSPSDEMTDRAYARCGELSPSSHLVYSPSPLLGAPDSIENVQVMSARAAMIVNGDVAIQLDLGPSDKDVAGAEPYVDAMGRTRLRLLWK